ncbi:hypothetical protein [Candidatus Kuenenia sp.]|uniref:hypothetical protein n=1 Tax=Candidatus Kuenenia sp. TaxID=2499824 RepID=UPI00321F9CF5
MKFLFMNMSKNNAMIFFRKKSGGMHGFILSYAVLFDREKALSALIIFSHVDGGLLLIPLILLLPGRNTPEYKSRV